MLAHGTLQLDSVCSTCMKVDNGNFYHEAMRSRQTPAREVVHTGKQVITEKVLQ